MGTCPASSHVKAGEVTRRARSPVVDLKIWTSTRSPYTSHPLCPERGKECGHLIVVFCSLPGMLLRGKSAVGEWLFVISYQMRPSPDSTIGRSAILTTGTHSPSFWDGHWPPPRFLRRQSRFDGWAIVDWTGPSTPTRANTAGCSAGLINCFQCLRSETPLPPVKCSLFILISQRFYLLHFFSSVSPLLPCSFISPFLSVIPMGEFQGK